ncbi:flagellar hook capping FlgD N-terminal domain-containing protein [Albibacillus kandeliae]|uniref:flagellar hook capping FlgD N-terminal domain-containing protein n=1 Tax=Albibacillus kandeliae TaxID=2174228 RepID=UPI000D699C9E|nr:flagellar hook capping FlgD N-terminal domain-containing protein [Albibacillus kandeliae]
MVTVTDASNSTSSAGASATASATTVSDGSVLTSDFETFLKMLTAQARYQDPLEPIDSTEFASQLAQFSMVEQQVKTNEVLDSVLGALAVQNAAALSTWIGMEARANAPALFSGQAVTLALAPASTADEVALVVRDSAGTEVQRQSVPLGTERLEWDGTGPSGESLPLGLYSFEVESLREGEVILTNAAEVYSRVVEAQAGEDEIVLLLDSGSTVPASAVSALRAP